MKMSQRELRLLGATLAVMLLCGTWLWLRPAFAEWKGYASRRSSLDERRALAEHLLASKPRVEAEMAEFLEGLPVYPMGKKAESTLLPALEALAGGDLLTKREVGAERPAGDLYETSITCHWQGTLERLVKFLYDQQSQGVASDMRALSVQTGGGQGGKQKDRLSGRFSIDYAYRRAAEGEGESANGADGGN